MALTPAPRLSLRVGLAGGGALALLLTELATALAQAPALPSAPAVPSGVPTALPSAIPTGMPSGLPTALPSAAPRPPPVPPPAPGGAQKPASPPPPLPPPTDSNVVLFDDKPTSADEIAGTLPKELHVNAEKEKRKKAEDVAGLAADTPVVSASNRTEGIRSALGSVIVLTAKDLRVRGYSDLSQMLDDLPGMDVIRPYGDAYVRSYVRGNRTAGADPYLLMVDGVPYNQLFTGSAQILASLPISAIDRVEIVYGPLSSVYGPGAAMGVINVITKDGREEQDYGIYGAHFDTLVSFGGAQHNFNSFANTSKIVDATASYVGKDYRVRISARLESSVLDTSAGDGFEFTKNSLYHGSAWGAGTLAAYPDLSGSFRSPDRKGAVDARIWFGRGTEIAGSFYTLSTGYGTEYRGDQRQNRGLFTSREISAYARHTADLTSGVVSKTLVQYRQSNLATTALTSNGSQVNLLDADSPSAAAVVQEDIEINTKRGLLLKDDQLGVGLGMRYRHLELPGGASGYNVVSSTTWSPGDDPLKIMTAPDQLTGAPVPAVTQDEIGAYALIKYAFNKAHSLNVGSRVDKSSFRSDINVSMRFGYAGTFLDMLTLKVWYGHSIFEPSYQQSLAALAAPPVYPGIKTDRLHNVEADLDFVLRFLALHVDGYFIYTTNPVVAFEGTPAFVNMGPRKLAGLDAGARFMMKPVNLWAYFSHSFLNEDSLPSTALPAGTAASDGDIAQNKVWAGLTVEAGPFAGTVLNRWMIGRSPVPTNSDASLPFYTTLDANLMLEDIGVNGFWFAVRATNIIGSAIDHPGIQTADSGVSTSLRSTGTYSSLLHQPGRAFFATVGFTYDPDRPLHDR